MVGLFRLFLFCLLLAYVVNRKTKWYPVCAIGIQQNSLAKILYLTILVSLLLFAGLRTRFNDTHSYIVLFNQMDTNIGNIQVLKYGGFDLYQHIIKRFISSNPQVFIFISSAITLSLYIPFITRHTDLFFESVLLFLFTGYITSMAAIKQILAMGFALIAIEAFIQKRLLRTIFFSVLAFSIHPFAICLLCIPLLNKKVWDKRTVGIIVLSIALIVNLESVFNVTSIIGKEYTLGEFTDYTINPFRVVVEAIPVLIVLINRNKINDTLDSEMILGANLLTIGFGFIFLGLFFNPMYMGRVATYYSIISAVEIPKILRTSFRSKIIVASYYLLFVAYYIADLTKLGSISIYQDIFQRTSFWTLFQ